MRKGWQVTKMCVLSHFFLLQIECRYNFKIYSVTIQPDHIFIESSDGLANNLTQLIIIVLFDSTKYFIKYLNRTIKKSFHFFSTLIKLELKSNRFSTICENHICNLIGICISFQLKCTVLKFLSFVYAVSLICIQSVNTIKQTKFTSSQKP